MRLQLTRRSFLYSSAAPGILGLSGTPLFGADFWNRKPASEWSPGEIEQIETKSPWAKKVYAVISGRSGPRTDGSARADSMDRPGTRGSFGGMTGADSNGISEGGGGGRGGGRRGGEGGLGGDSGPSGPTAPEVIVRWDSAKPVLDATKLTLPADMTDHYVLSVTGLPPQVLIAQFGRGSGAEDPQERQKQMIERLMHSASLTAKGRDPEVADQVRQIQNRQSIVFGFLRENLKLTAADRDVEFILKLGGLTVKAKFQPKEMIYKGELSA